MKIHISYLSEFETPSEKYTLLCFYTYFHKEKRVTMGTRLWILTMSQSSKAGTPVSTENT